MTGNKQPKPRSDSAFPVSPPVKAPSRKDDPSRAGAPDLHIEEIEEKHIPKDRNIFDK